MNLPPLQSAPHDIDTPALCVDLDRMEANIGHMVACCRQQKIDWRPHSKCHKSPAIAKKLVAAGAIGVTCAKVGEAEVMAAAGVTDLLIANQIVGAQKVARLVELRRTADPVICFDHLDQARPIGEAMHDEGLAIRALIEVDIGMQRAGTLPGEPSVQLATALAQLPGIQFAGVMGYEGHLLRVADPAEKEERIRTDIGTLVKTKELVESHDIECPICSCGGTGSYAYSASQPGITEIQAGGAIFMDDYYRNQCHVEGLDFALTLMATVVSRPAPDRAIIDAGRKTMNAELEMPRVISRTGIQVQGLSAEHGTLHLEPEAEDLAIGDRLVLMPGYSDFTCVLHDRFFAFRDQSLEEIWPLEGRGRLQ